MFTCCIFRRHALIATVSRFHSSEPEQGARGEIVNSSRLAEMDTVLIRAACKCVRPRGGMVPRLPRLPEFQKHNTATYSDMICVCVYMYVCMYIYIYIYLYVCIYIYIYIKLCMLLYLLYIQGTRPDAEALGRQLFNYCVVMFFLYIICFKQL